MTANRVAELTLRSQLKAGQLGRSPGTAWLSAAKHNPSSDVHCPPTVFLACLWMTGLW